MVFCWCHICLYVATERSFAASRHPPNASTLLANPLRNICCHRDARRLRVVLLVFVARWLCFVCNSVPNCFYMRQSRPPAELTRQVCLRHSREIAAAAAPKPSQTSLICLDRSCGEHLGAVSLLRVLVCFVAGCSTATVARYLLRLCRSCFQVPSLLSTLDVLANQFLQASSLFTAFIGCRRPGESLRHILMVKA